MKTFLNVRPLALLSLFVAHPTLTLPPTIRVALYAQPMCIKEGDKIKLSIAVWNDSLFLNSLGVMDYSLLVGIDTDRGELVVGIIGSYSSALPSSFLPVHLLCIALDPRHLPLP